MQRDAKDLDNVEHAAGGGEPAVVDLTSEAGRKAAWDADAKLHAEFNDNFGDFNAYYKNASNHRTFKPGGNAQ